PRRQSLQPSRTLCDKLWKLCVYAFFGCLWQPCRRLLFNIFHETSWIPRRNYSLSDTPIIGVSPTAEVDQTRWRLTFEIPKSGFAARHNRKILQNLVRRIGSLSA